jgi:hypothetical protein
VFGLLGINSLDLFFLETVAVEIQTLPVLCGNQKIFQTDKKLEK